MVNLLEFSWFATYLPKDNVYLVLRGREFVVVDGIIFLSLAQDDRDTSPAPTPPDDTLPIGDGSPKVDEKQRLKQFWKKYVVKRGQVPEPEQEPVSEEEPVGEQAEDPEITSTSSESLNAEDFPHIYDPNDESPESEPEGLEEQECLQDMAPLDFSRCKDLTQEDKVMISRVLGGLDCGPVGSYTPLCAKIRQDRWCVGNGCQACKGVAQCLLDGTLDDSETVDGRRNWGNSSDDGSVLATLFEFPSSFSFIS